MGENTAQQTHCWAHVVHCSCSQSPGAWETSISNAAVGAGGYLRQIAEAHDWRQTAADAAQIGQDLQKSLTYCAKQLILPEVKVRSSKVQQAGQHAHQACLLFVQEHGVMQGHPVSCIADRPVSCIAQQLLERLQDVSGSWVHAVHQTHSRMEHSDKACLLLCFCYCRCLSTYQGQHGSLQPATAFLRSLCWT
jgi:hypothetical protein